MTVYLGITDNMQLCAYVRAPMPPGVYVHVNMFPFHPLMYFNIQLKPSHLIKFELTLLNSCFPIIIK